MRRLAFLAAALAVATSANATIIATMTAGPVAQGGGLFDYDYMASLSGSERLDPGATALDYPDGTFFTIYDINGYVSASAPTDWVAVSQTVGITPSLINGSFDNPNLINVTFVYTGSVVHGPVDINGFVITSSNSSVTKGMFTSQSTKEAPDTDGSTDQVVGFTLVPAAVPEPSTFLGFAMIGLGLIRSRGKRA